MKKSGGISKVFLAIVAAIDCLLPIVAVLLNWIKGVALVCVSYKKLVISVIYLFFICIPAMS
jgi:hypothetical protein